MIEKIKALIHKYKQFILFCFVGASNTLITVFVFWLLNQKLGVTHLVASALAYACGVVNGYIWSTAVVFRKRRTSQNALKFILVNLLVLGVNTLLMYVWINLLGISEMPAQLLTTAFTMVLNFTLNKLWTFREQKSNQTP